MTAADPIGELEHDHAHLTRLVFDLRDIAERVQRPEAPTEDAMVELASCLEALRDDLFLHFAREEEGLFPYAQERFPELRGDIARIEAAHDGICGSLGRMGHLVGGGAARFPERLPGFLALLARFEAAYAAHSQDESALLKALAGRLDARQRGEIAELVRGL